MRVTKHLSGWHVWFKLQKSDIATDFFGCSCPLPSHSSPATKRVWPITKKIKKEKRRRKKHAGHALLKATAIVDLTHDLWYKHESPDKRVSAQPKTNANSTPIKFAMNKEKIGKKIEKKKKNKGCATRRNGPRVGIVFNSSPLLLNINDTSLLSKASVLTHESHTHTTWFFFFLIIITFFSSPTGYLD